MVTKQHSCVISVAMKHVQAHEIKAMLNTKRKIISLIGNHGNKTTMMEHIHVR